jgi:serine/threonine protein phosphatase PrpC
MDSKRINCWGFKKCKREQGGINSDRLGVCPAEIDPAFDGFNLGIKSGRTCWLVAGTFCDGKAQGTYAKKQASCKSCDFYKKVHDEEGVANLTSEFIDLFAISQIGLVKDSNEDRYFISRLVDGSILMAVADGLGGHVSGDYAAEITIAKLASIRLIEQGMEEQQLCNIAKNIDLIINKEIEKDPAIEVMGTTLTCVLLRDGVAYWVHVGDSRFYLLRDRELIRQTEDQTLARFLLAEGEITEEEAPYHYSRHIMDQSLGCSYCEPETGRHEIKNRDLLILASDGLYKEIEDFQINFLLNIRPDLETCIRSLVIAALHAGGNDNITIVAMEIKSIKNSCTKK